METHKISMVILLITFLMTTTLRPFKVEGGNIPQNYIRAHNAVRAKVAVGNLTWNKNLADYARAYAYTRLKECNTVTSRGPFGENIAIGSEKHRDISAEDAVQIWYSEKDDYDYELNKCRQGKECRHYLQVVWRNTTHFGCARVAHCENNGPAYVICSYDPPGNIDGQRPF